LLIEGLKFDLRLYVLLACCDPLRIFLYKDGLARLATIKYQKPNNNNIDKEYMHLTNYSINKLNEEFQFNSDNEKENTGHKRSMKLVFEMLGK